jgi:hypothetical protein
LLKEEYDVSNVWAYWLMLVILLPALSGQVPALATQTPATQPEQDEASTYVPREVPAPPAPPQRDLKFVEQVGEVADTYGSRVTARAMFQVQANISQQNMSVYWLDRTRGWQDLSESQRDLLREVAARQSYSSPVLAFSRMQPFEGSLPIYGVYAVSPDQGRKTIDVVLRRLDAAVVEEWQQLKTRQETFMKGLQTAREAVPRLQSEIEQLTTKGKDLAMSLQGMAALPPAEETRATVLKYNDIIKSADLEIAGIKARIQAANKILDRHPSSEVSRNLEQALVNLDVELGGLLARREAAGKPLKQAEDLYAIQMRLTETGQELRKMSDQQRYALRDLKGIDRTLEDPPESMQFVKVIDDRVVIVTRPAKQAESRPAGEQ